MGYTRILYLPAFSYLLQFVKNLFMCDYMLIFFIYYWKRQPFCKAIVLLSRHIFLSSPCLQPSLILLVTYHFLAWIRDVCTCATWFLLQACKLLDGRNQMCFVFKNPGQLFKEKLESQSGPYFFIPVSTFHRWEDWDLGEVRRVAETLTEN